MEPGRAKRIPAWLAGATLLAGCGVFGGGDGGGGAPPDPAFVAAFFAADVRVDAPPVDPPYASDPALAADGMTVHATWEGYDYGNGDYSVRYSRSTDGGATWLPADVRLDTTPAYDGEDDVRSPQIWADGSHVRVIWMDEDSGEVHFNRSTDGGATWLAQDLRIDTEANPRCPEDARLACDGDAVHVVWRVDGCFFGGVGRVLYQRSLDGGASWLAQDVVLTPALPDVAPEGMRLWCEGNDVRVVWHDARNGGRDVWFRRSGDGGATWDPEVRLDTDAPGAADSTFPAIAGDATRVYVAWHDDRSGGWGPRFRASANGGATWAAADVGPNTPATFGGNADLDLASDGLVVHLVFAQRPDGGEDVFYQRSADGGATWAATDVRLDTDAPGAADSSVPRLSCRGRNVYVAWVDGRTGIRQPRFQYSTDHGVTWAASDLGLSTDPGGEVDDAVALATDGAHAYVAWSDDRLGDATIFLNASTPP